MLPFYLATKLLRHERLIYSSQYYVTGLPYLIRRHACIHSLHMHCYNYIHVHFSDTSVHAMAYESYFSYLEICSTICTSNHDITKVYSSYIEQWFRTHHSMLCHLACAIQTIVVWSIGYSPLQGHVTPTYN